MIVRGSSHLWLPCFRHVQLGFQWELPDCDSHALQQRMRNITRAASTLRKMYQTCPASGAGWTTQIVARGKGSKIAGDRYYFSPEGKRFRSMAEVRRHLDENRDEEDRSCPQKQGLAKVIATETIKREEKTGCRQGRSPRCHLSYSAIGRGVRT